MGDVSAQLIEFTTLIGDLVQLARDETGGQAGAARLPRRRQLRARSRPPPRTRPAVRRRTRPVLRRRRVRHPGAGDDQPARQRGEVEPAGGHHPGPARGRSAPGGRSRTGHRRGGPAPRLRSFLPGRHRPQHPRHRPRAVDRGAAPITRTAAGSRPAARRREAPSSPCTSPAPPAWKPCNRSDRGARLSSALGSRRNPWKVDPNDSSTGVSIGLSGPISGMRCPGESGGFRICRGWRTGCGSAGSSEARGVAVGCRPSPAAIWTRKRWPR